MTCPLNDPLAYTYGLTVDGFDCLPHGQLFYGCIEELCLSGQWHVGCQGHVLWRLCRVLPFAFSGSFGQEGKASPSLKIIVCTNILAEGAGGAAMSIPVYKAPSPFKAIPNSIT